VAGVVHKCVSGFPPGGSDPSALSTDMKTRLTRAKDAILANPLIRVDVVGHTDATGTSAENALLGVARARGVRDHLHALGVPAAQFMEVVGQGSTECPPGPADNPACRKTEIFLFQFQAASLRNP
jgi:outer membrane protein OmpA-like peptidoglycan-associated protein